MTRAAPSLGRFAPQLAAVNSKGTVTRRYADFLIGTVHVLIAEIEKSFVLDDRAADGVTPGVTRCSSGTFRCRECSDPD